MRTSLKGVYAIGDLVPVGPAACAQGLRDEGVIAVEDAAGMDTHPDRLTPTSRAPRFLLSAGGEPSALTEKQAKGRPGTTW